MKPIRQRHSRAGAGAAGPPAGAALKDFGTAELRRIVGMSQTALRSLVRQGYVLPSRGTRGTLRFSFQDLIVLRAARTLAQAGLTTRRLSRALRELRQHLPAELPLSGLSIRAAGEHVVVRTAGTEWESGSGQYLLALEVSIGHSGLRLDEAQAETQAQTQDDAEALFLEALASEDGDASTAILLYRRCLRADPKSLEARINLGRLLQETGDVPGAERLYRHASCRGHAVAQFNLGVLLEDRGQLLEAIERYVSAVSLDPGFADAHFNLARLYDLQGNIPHTIRHLRALQRLGRPAQG